MRWSSAGILCAVVTFSVSCASVSDPSPIAVASIADVPGLDADVEMLVETHLREQLALAESNPAMPVFFDHHETLGVVSASGGEEAYFGIAGRSGDIRTASLLAMRRSADDSTSWHLTDGLLACDSDQRGLVFGVTGKDGEGLVIVLNPAGTNTAHLGSTIEVTESQGAMQVWKVPDLSSDGDKVIHDVLTLGESVPTELCPAVEPDPDDDHDHSHDQGEEEGHDHSHDQGERRRTRS